MKARHRLTILGCGSSPGVPRIGNDWGACDPAEPRNRRRRASALIERFSSDGARTVVLIDTGPDLREQMLDAGIAAVDGVVYTHPHADHIHGIDELRAFMLNRGRRTDIWCDAVTSERLNQAFGYCFSTPEGSSYPPIVDEHRLTAGSRLSIPGPGGEIVLLPFAQIHGEITSLGFRIGDVCYSSDLNGLPENSLAALANLDIWIVDALRHKPHSSHFSLTEALEWAGRLGVRRTVLTHMHVDLDYATLKASLPTNVEPAYDGMRIDFLA